MYDSDEVKERVRAEVGRWMWEPAAPGEPSPRLSTVEQRTVEDAWAAQAARAQVGRNCRCELVEARRRPVAWRALFLAMMGLALGYARHGGRR